MLSQVLMRSLKFYLNIMFSIATLNPLRFIDTSNINFGFDGNFAVDQVLSYQNPKCYCQKWQLSDTLRLQVLSDFVPTDLLIKDLYSDLTVASVAWAEKPTIIIDQTFKVYELEYQFITLPEGKYYTQFSYEDENEVEHLLISEPIYIAQVQENTLLLQYKNSINDFDVIFDTGIVFNFRVESAIKDYTPGNNRAIYNDQNVNPTLLSATPFRKFKFYLGFQYGIPEWVFDKVNWIQSVDQVKYNNVFYQIVEGSDYETSSNPDNSFMGGSIEVHPTNNNFNRYQTDPSGEDDGDLIYVMGRRSDYFNISDNFTVPGVFKAESLLEQIKVTKRGPAGDLTFKVGTTAGGDEIGEFVIDNSKWIQTVPFLFSGTTTLYVTGLDGADMDIDISFLYLQTDAPPIDLGSIVPAPVIELGKNSVMIYEETIPGELEADFDLSTGLGKANTTYSGWAICDGRNGTEDRSGVVPVGADLRRQPGDPGYDADFVTVGSRGGAKTHTLTVPELPAHDHQTDMKPNIAGSGGSRGAQGPMGSGLTNTTGQNMPHNNMQPYLVSLWIKKIA